MRVHRKKRKRWKRFLTPFYPFYPSVSDFSVDANQVSDIANVYLYTGRERDPETGLQLNRNRFYASHLGRWLTRDPLGYEAGMNLYGYLSGRPTRTTDPLGLEPYLAPVFQDHPWKRKPRFPFGKWDWKSMDYQVYAIQQIDINIQYGEEDGTLLTTYWHVWEWPTESMVVDDLRDEDGKWNPENKTYPCRILVECALDCPGEDRIEWRPTGGEWVSGRLVWDPLGGVICTPTGSSLSDAAKKRCAAGAAAARDKCCGKQ